MEQREIVGEDVAGNEIDAEAEKSLTNYEEE